MLIAVFFACRVELDAAEAPVIPELSPPTLASVDVTCSVDDDMWTIEAEATSWTGGGVWFATVDGQYVESHRVDARTAEPDGSGESLEAEVEVVVDWREAGSGASAFHCAEAVAWRFVLRDPEGRDADCVRGGDGDPGLLDVEGVPECP